jgi:hypothetical protein
MMWDAAEAIGKKCKTYDNDCYPGMAFMKWEQLGWEMILKISPE